MKNMNTVEVLGYSERGIFNSIVFYLQAHPELVGDFLKVLQIDDNSECFGESVKYTILSEQSFSDFGNSDLVIIAENNNTKLKTVVFIEGKVKTCQGSFSIDRKFDDLKQKKVFAGISSNIFVQLYYKYLLVNILKENKTDTSSYKLPNIFKKNDGNDRKIGKNEIVEKAREKIGYADTYYFVAILPKNEDFKKRFEELNATVFKTMPIPIEKIQSVSWEDVEHLFKDATIVSRTFEYNKGQIY
ncbi:hypothetical protein [Candidatus Symbiothrix dinenymphae]|uniref:hypothetical protein n=1 Tax=Candidatus Symbiothrix dinenymphae TaxID=467085 RepID=UPI0007038D50|nr:hypothetical protein [Candidatus Symbiothrix dinenymphae]